MNASRHRGSDWPAAGGWSADSSRFSLSVDPHTKLFPVRSCRRIWSVRASTWPPTALINTTLLLYLLLLTAARLWVLKLLRFPADWRKNTETVRQLIVSSLSVTTWVGFAIAGARRIWLGVGGAFNSQVQVPDGSLHRTIWYRPGPPRQNKTDIKLTSAHILVFFPQQRNFSLNQENVLNKTKDFLWVNAASFFTLSETRYGRRGDWNDSNQSNSCSL